MRRSRRSTTKEKHVGDFIMMVGDLRFGEPHDRTVVTIAFAVSVAFGGVYGIKNSTS
jgi:hypothetical protein